MEKNSNSKIDEKNEHKPYLRPVVTLIIYKDGKILLQKRDDNGCWAIHGGGIEMGEKYLETLQREIKEELDTKISVDKLIDTVEYDYDTFHLSMACYWCSLESDKIILKEHEAARWLTQDELYNVEWLPADISIVDSVRDEMKQDKNK